MPIPESVNDLGMGYMVLIDFNYAVPYVRLGWYH